MGLGPDVIVTAPFGYRSSLALQLHAAVVLTDSGGVQREAGWLGVPCLILRSTSEWVELVEASAGKMVLVGLDRALAVRDWPLVPVGPVPHRRRNGQRRSGWKRPGPPKSISAVLAAAEMSG